MGQAGQNNGALLMREICLHENIKVIVSNRFGGVSKGAYESLNLGLHVGDNPLNVLKNREIFASFFDANMEDLCFMEQTHSSKARVVESAVLSHSDAIITQQKNIVLCVMSADCVPVILFDQKTKTAAAIHAGRNGAFLNIIANTLSVMKENFGSNPTNIIAFLGASVRSCCYEIQSEILKTAKKDFGYALEKQGKKWFLDIQQIIKTQLQDNGILSIKDDNVCTCCNEDYFSYRREKNCGRFATGIKII